MNVCRISVRKYPGKCPLGRRRRWKDNIDVDLRQIYGGYRGWMGLPQQHVKFCCHSVNQSDLYCFRKQRGQYNLCEKLKGPIFLDFII